jgi:uncharacterized protein YraI
MKTRMTFSGIMIAVTAAILLVAVVFSPSPASAAELEDYVVNTSVLNLRSGPGLDFSVQRLLFQGQKISVLDKSENGQWSEVRLSDGTQGWVYNAYIVSAGKVVQASSYVLIPRLNLRAGPGVSYRVLKVLEKGIELSVIGRSLISDWLVVRLADGTEGWVFSPYVQTDAEIASLPVMEAFGGPTNGGTGTISQRLNILVTIRENVAVVDVLGFAAGADLTVRLGLPGEDTDLTVATGAAGADGSARLTFKMPSKWSDGSAIKQENLVVLVRADDGSKSIKANILYYK